MHLVLNKMTGRIHDVPDDHWTLNPAEWPRGRAERAGKLVEVYSEEFVVLDASQYERDAETGEWVEVTSSRSRSRSTRTKNEPES